MPIVVRGKVAVGTHKLDTLGAGLRHLLFQSVHRGIDSVLGHHAVSGVLATGDHRQTSDRTRHRMLTRESAGRIRFAEQQRTQPRVHTDDVLVRQLVLKELVDMSEDVVDIASARCRMGEVEVPVGVRRTDDPVASPRDHEQQTLLGPRDDSGRGVDAVSRDDQVHTFRSANLELPSPTDHFLDLVGPDPGGVDDLTSTDLERATCFQIHGLHPDYAVLLTEKADYAGAVHAQCAVFGCCARQHHRVAGVIYLTLVELDRTPDSRALSGRERFESLLLAHMLVV